MASPFTIPQSLSPAFVISRCNVADTDTLGDVYYDSFKADPGNTHWWSPSREHMMDWMRVRISKKMHDRGIRHFKIADVESGDIVAWARWTLPKGSKHFGEWVGVEGVAADVTTLVEDEPKQESTAQLNLEISASAPAVEPQTKSIDIPEGADPDLVRNFFDALAVASRKWFTDDMLGLGLICTNPKYQRRGAAKALIVPMLDIADAQGIATYLEATPAGKPVYEKLGFREVDALDFDLNRLTKDLDGIYRLTVMIRQPQTRQ